MQNKMSRRDVLATTAATAVLSTIGLSSSAQAVCGHNHKKLGFRLGAKMVDPKLSEAERVKLLANAHCAACGAGIDPAGLSYIEHMPKR